MTSIDSPRFPLKRWATAFVACWTLVNIFFGAYVFHLVDQSALAEVHAKALAAFNKDQSFRFWATMHGGAYVPITDQTPPNEYLAHVPERDITTPAGRDLTLMNPAYLVRQLNESYGTLYGTKGHITSLKPLRPGNEPDEWEQAALKKFENGINEVFELSEIDGEQYARLMRPMVTGQGCLKCHAHQGYQVGDIRGGVSVSVAVAPSMLQGLALKTRSGIILFVLWALGSTFILLGSTLLGKNLQQRDILANNLKDAKRSAEAANAAKSDFLANMSHEIRTPLNGIMGMLQLFNSTKLNPEQAEYVDAALHSSERLTYLLSDILDLSMVEKGVLPFRKEPVSVSETIGHIDKLFEVSTRQTGVTLESVIAPGVPDKIETDPTRLQQLLTNLVGNSLKFTKHGKVTVHVSDLPSTEPDRCSLLFTVTDTGNGIPENKIGSIFAPFAQVADGYTRSYQGAGLGLAICKRLVDTIGGSICVDSVLGEGTSFYCSMTFNTVPIAKSSTEPDTRQDALAELGISILLAEDDRVNRMVAERLMKKMGCRVTSVENGRAAVDALRDEAFDLVVMDIQMPIMNGVDAVKAIRAGEAGDRRRATPIIALTAYAMDADRARFATAGMNGYLPKPIDATTLMATLKEYAHHA